MSIAAFLKSEPVVLSEQLSIKLIEPSDMQEIIEMLDDPKVTKYLFFAPAPVEVYMGYFEPMIDNVKKAIEDNQRPNNIIGVARDNDGRFMGMCGLTGVMFLSGNFEIGYQLPEHAWKQGIATQMCEFINRVAFEALNAHKVCADCYATNVGSYKTLEKCGFILEGLQQGYYKWDDGLDNRLLYGMTKAQFEAIYQ